MGRKAPRKRLACRVMCTSNGCRCTRTTLGAPPTPRFGVGEAKWITPRAKARWKRRAIVKDGLIPNRAMSTEAVANASCAGRSASKTRVNALMTRASIFFARSLYEDGWIAGSSPAMTERMGHAHRFHLLDLLGTQPAAVRNRDWGNFHCFGLILTMEIATPTCWASEAYITPYVTHDVPPSVVIRCGTIRRHDVSPSVVIMCFGCEAPMPPAASI